MSFLAAIVLLTYSGHDTAALIGVGRGILGGLGLAIGQGQGVSESVNGNTTKILEAQGRLLAQMTPSAAAPSTPAAEPAVEDQAA